MKRCLLVVIPLFSFLLASPAFAEGDGEKSFKAYADLAVGGVWVTEIKGEKHEHRYERILDGRFVRMTAKATKNFPGVNSILGVDPKTHKFTLWRFDTKGALSIGTSELVSDGVWMNTWEAKGPDGTSSGKGRLTKVDADTIKFKVLENKINGKITPFPEFTVWKRKKD